MLVLKKSLVVALVLLSSLFIGGSAMAATVGNPDPAVGGDVVTVTPTDKVCAERINAVQNAGIGVIVVSWPDGTQSTITPLPNPIVVTVPAGMMPGTAKMQVYKGMDGGVPAGLYEDCNGSFEIVEDASVPVFDSRVILGLLVVSGFGLLALGRRKDQSFEV